MTLFLPAFALLLTLVAFGFGIWAIKNHRKNHRKKMKKKKQENIPIRVMIDDGQTSCAKTDKD